MVKLITTDIVGSAGKRTWSQVQKFNYNDMRQVMVVVQLVEDEESMVELAEVGAGILSEVERLGQQVYDISGLEKILQEIKLSVREGITLELLLALVDEMRLGLCGNGKVEAYLSRDRQLARLKNDWGEGGQVEGVLRVGDSVVLATRKFVEVIGNAKLKEVLTLEENPAELFAPLVHMQEDSSGMAAIVLSIEEERVEKKSMIWPVIHLRQTEPRKVNMWIGAGILVLLMLMIGIGMVRRTSQVAETEFLSLSMSVGAKIEETLMIGDLNPERARILLSQAKNEVETYLSTEVKDEYKQKGVELTKKIEEADERAFKKNEIALETLVELSVLSEGLSAKQMKSDGKGNLIFLDQNEKKIVAMNVSDRSRQMIEVPENESYLDLGVSESKLYGLRSNGVTELFWKKNEPKKVIEADEFWKEPTSIETFAGNLYVLDKGQGEIWKYPVLDDGFGGRRRWLAAGITLDLSNVIDIKVVGDVWLLTSTGKLERYSRGAPVAFTMEGFPAKGEAKRFSEPSSVWVTENLVYVLENGSSRVVVFGDDGKYQSQYVSSEFGKASDLVVVDSKGYVLIDNVVKEFGL